jgi:guanylate kinase
VPLTRPNTQQDAGLRRSGAEGMCWVTKSQGSGGRRRAGVTQATDALTFERGTRLVMKTLFMIDGAAGTGKTDLIEYIGQKYCGRGRTAFLTKKTTRRCRPEERERGLRLDLAFVSHTAFRELSRSPGFYSYEYGGERYGFNREDIDRLLAEHEQVFVIVRDRATIEQLIADYPRVCTVPVFIYTDKDEVQRRLMEDGYSRDEVAFRLGRQRLAWDDYLKHSPLYKEVIVNNSNRNDFHRLIDNLIREYSVEAEPADLLVVSHCERFPLLRSLVGFKKAIRDHLGNYDSNVFLMMKFRDANRLVFEFIRNTLEASGFVCVRADLPEWDITKNVYNPLAVAYCCKYGIALFDEPEPGNAFSPNVAYELSMMHFQQKDCLILRNSALAAMPFDLIKDLHEPYTRDLELERIVKMWVSKMRDSARRSTQG